MLTKLLLASIPVLNSFLTGAETKLFFDRDRGETGIKNTDPAHV